MKSFPTIFLAILMLSISACTKEGPMGPQGPQGLPGEDGQDGQNGSAIRIVYYSANLISSDDLTCFAIPEITNSNMPLIAVYAAPNATPLTWGELPVWIPYTQQQMWYSFSEGEVCVENCQGYWIKIVIVL